MKRKARIQTGIDDRLVAIYARSPVLRIRGTALEFSLSKAPTMRSISFPYRKITNLPGMRTKV